MIIISGGSSHAVTAGQTESGDIVLSGGVLDVFSGGKIIDTVLSGGDDFVFGVASGTTISSGGFEDLIGGTASGTLVNAHGSQTVHQGGTAISTTLSGITALQVIS